MLRPEWIERIQAAHPSLDVFWDRRTKAYCICQKNPTPLDPDPAIRFTTAPFRDDGKTHWRYLFPLVDAEGNRFPPYPELVLAVIAQCCVRNDSPEADALFSPPVREPLDVSYDEIKDNEQTRAFEAEAYKTLVLNRKTFDLGRHAG